MTESTFVETLVGKRCLLKLSPGNYRRYDSAVEEYRVLEISPSRAWLKLRNLNGCQFWVPIADVSHVETLRDLRGERMETKPDAP